MTEAQQNDAIAALMAGDTLAVVAKRHAVSLETVRRLAAPLADQLAAARAKRRADQLKTWSIDRRLALSDQLFRRVSDGLSAAEIAPADLRNLAVTYGIAVEKRRLEDGDATARTEISQTSARERIAARLAALRARKQEQGAEPAPAPDGPND